MLVVTMKQRWRLIVLSALFALAPAQSLAAVEITFYSKEFGASFPHNFVTLVGIPDRGGERIDANYGFTATHVTPAVLMGAVKGEVMAADAKYVAKSDPHFSLTLSDEEYDRVVAEIDRWRQLPQPSYRLNTQNCVFFVADLAETLGMKVETPAKLMKKPRSFLESVVAANRAWLATRGAVLARR